MKPKYYTLKRILEYNANYNMIFGERSNGKTYSVLLHGLKDYVQTGRQLAIVRRWREDFTGKRGTAMFSALVDNGEVSKLTKGEWTGIYYFASKWFLSREGEDGKREVSEDPIAYGFALSAQEHDKSTSYPRIGNVLFDEFITRNQYLADEFVLFMNTLSTIIRRRTDVKIFMLGNTVNRYCPYFSEMGITHVKEMKQGDIDVYTYGESKLTVAVEYTPTEKKGKESNFYFAFDNPKLAMITGGEWELDIYPHCPYKYKPKDVVFTYFVEFNSELLQCEIVKLDNISFTFVHRKTTELQSPGRDLIFSTKYSALPNWRRKITTPVTDLEKRILWYYKTDKVFFQDNEVGETMRNYLIWCNE